MCSGCIAEVRGIFEVGNMSVLTQHRSRKLSVLFDTQRRRMRSSDFGATMEMRSETVVVESGSGAA
jgi:hypothetical protein